MTEGQFWKELRARINRLRPEDGFPEFPGWCDWFDPKSYSGGATAARIVGRVLFVKAGRTYRWRFTLVVNRSITSFEDFDWQTLQDLVPDEGETGWLTADGERLTIELPRPASS